MTINIAPCHHQIFKYYINIIKAYFLHLSIIPFARSKPNIKTIASQIKIMASRNSRGGRSKSLS